MMRGVFPLVEVAPYFEVPSKISAMLFFFLSSKSLKPINLKAA
jgi:hypothetical protein